VPLKITAKEDPFSSSYKVLTSKVNDTWKAQHCDYMGQNLYCPEEVCGVKASRPNM
jgi:hypothetical protein